LDPPGVGAERHDRPTRYRSRAAVPALASGMGQFHQLKRRFVMLRQGDVPRALTRGGLMAVFTLGGLLLPVVPTFAQVLAPQPVPPTPVTPAPATKIDSVSPEERSAREDVADRDLKPVEADDPAARNKDEHRKEELNRARDREKLALDKQRVELQKQLAESRAEVQKLAAALAQAEARMQKLEMAAAVEMRDGQAYWANKIKPAPDIKPNLQALKDAKIRPSKGLDGKDDHGDRLDAIEQQLQGLLQEVKSMRAERRAEEKMRSKGDGKSKDGPPTALPTTPPPTSAAR